MENLSPSVKAVVRDSGSLQMQRKQTVKQVGSHPTNTVHFACFACRVAFKQRIHRIGMLALQRDHLIVQTAKDRWCDSVGTSKRHRDVQCVNGSKLNCCFDSVNDSSAPILGWIQNVIHCLLLFHTLSTPVTNRPTFVAHYDRYETRGDRKRIHVP